MIGPWKPRTQNCTFKNSHNITWWLKKEAFRQIKLRLCSILRLLDPAYCQKGPSQYENYKIKRQYFLGLWQLYLIFKKLAMQITTENKQLPYATAWCWQSTWRESTWYSSVSKLFWGSPVQYCSNIWTILLLYGWICQFQDYSAASQMELLSIRTILCFSGGIAQY